MIANFLTVKFKKPLKALTLKSDTLYKNYNFLDDTMDYALIQGNYITKLFNKRIDDYSKKEDIYKNILIIAQQCDIIESDYNFVVTQDAVYIGGLMAQIKENLDDYKNYLEKSKEGTTIQVIIELN